MNYTEWTREQLIARLEQMGDAYCHQTDQVEADNHLIADQQERIFSLNALLDDLQSELKRLRRIEVAFNGVTDLPLPKPWRVLATILRDEGYKRWAELIDDIANELEGEPE